jgi:hypothetical protein
LSAQCHCTSGSAVARKAKAALANGKPSKNAKDPKAAKERKPSGLNLAAEVLAASKDPLAATPQS